MTVLWAALLLGHPQAERAPPLDFTPLKAPLERVAGAVEKALGQLDQARHHLLQGLNWTAVGAAVLLTFLVLHTIHLHGLAASKSNRHFTESHP